MAALEQADSAQAFLDIVERGVAEGVCEDRREFFEALAALMHGDLELAAEGFRRAHRASPAPFGEMACYAWGRCEAVRGRDGVALRLFKKIARGESPPEIRRLAWMEVEALALTRDDRILQRKAREALEQLDRELNPVPAGTT